MRDGRREPLESRPALGTRSRAAVHGDGTFDRGALGGDRARVVPRIRLLLERRVVLLVDDDEAQARHRREDRRSSSDDDRRSPGRDPRALVTPLRVGQRRVEDRDPVAEACAEASDGLRRQRDLRDEHDDGAPPLERCGGRLQVDLGLPASGRPMEQNVTSRAVERSHDPRDGVALLRRQLVRLGLADEPAARRLARRTAPRTRMRSDQRQRPRRRRSVVVGEPERELDERRRHPVDDGARIGDVDTAGSRDVEVDHDAPHAARAELNRDDIALRDVVRDAIRERTSEGARRDERVDLCKPHRGRA